MNVSRILLVGDEPSELFRIKEFLEIEGYAVEIAANEEQALLHLNPETAPELIMLDMLLAGTTGLQVLERCKKVLPQQKIVMMSGSNEVNPVVEAIKLGAEDFITKLCPPSQLREVVCV